MTGTAGVLDLPSESRKQIYSQLENDSAFQGNVNFTGQTYMQDRRVDEEERQKVFHMTSHDRNKTLSEVVSDPSFEEASNPTMQAVARSGSVDEGPRQQTEATARSLGEETKRTRSGSNCGLARSSSSPWSVVPLLHFFHN